MKKETPKTMEFEGVVFTPEMLKYLRELQANEGQKIDEEINLFESTGRIIVELSANANTMYEEAIHSASLINGYVTFFEMFRKPETELQ